MANMYELRCRGKMDCHWHTLIKECDVILPAGDNPDCPVCRSNSWVLNETTMTEKSYFKRMLRDPHGTIGYHIIREDSA